MKIELIKLCENDGHEIYEMLQELPEDENGFINPMFGKSFDEYKEWLKKCVADANQAGIIDGWKVPQNTYWLYVDKKPVGYGKIRHFLTDKLLADGGNIGYSIRPSQRNKGFGNILLSELVKECSNIGVDRALLTIHKNNTPSINIALKNHGVIEKSSDELHYIWIDCCQTLIRLAVESDIPIIREIL